ncbi:MAG: O-antigen ligase family protein, partial [Nannocystaceae bacterium]
VLPLPPALHALCFPKLTALRAELLPPESLESWYPVSLAPGQTLAEAARLGALAILFFSCRQVSRASVWYAVFLSGSLVALIGLVQFILGVDRILGLYVPMDQPPDEYRPVAVLLGTFVNPNHQAGLFLVSLGAGAALIRRSLSKLRGLERPAGRDLSDLAIGNILVALIAVALMLTYSRAGMTMLGALVLVSVLSFLKSGAFKGTTAALLCLPVAALLALFAWSRVNFSVSWSELATLTTPEGHDKLRVLLEHRNLLPFSHALGLGRGSISSLLPLTSTIPSGRTMTHVESMPIVLVLEYGAVLGSVILIGVLTWFVRAFRARHDASSTLILATLAAICCQNFVDFNL